MVPDFLVHDSSDLVGVAVTEGVEPGRELTGWVMDTDETISIVSKAAIPLGHKIALVALAVDDTVVKYGHDIGRMVEACEEGDHVHVHNLKTKKW
jgi:(2R)-sulfolactate sulfo-lyase subunit alpha